jgi:hydrogenase nickel incorporation protein HypB
MCETCGCGEALKEGEQSNEHSHGTYSHSHPHPHPHTHEEGAGSRILRLEENLSAHNDAVAKENQAWLRERGVRTLNLISSPGAGKTLLIEKTLERLGGKKAPVAVLTGDLQTDNDAERIGRVTSRVQQINTINSCHLDAEMVRKRLPTLIPDGVPTKLLLIENVGNLVCPAAFRLGEDEIVALLSVAEGEDKPVKYPVLFSKADLVIITKVDLARYTEWNADRCLSAIRRVNGNCPVLTLSAKTGEGMDAWLSHLSV